MLRTPWPFVHEVREEAPVEAPKPARPWQRGKPKKSRRDEREDGPRKGSAATSGPRSVKVESWDDLPEDLEEVLASGESVEFEVPMPEAKPERVAVDLTMKGAVGRDARVSQHGDSLLSEAIGLISVIAWRRAVHPPAY